MLWREQQEKRNQTNFGMYFYTDFTGYGTREVMENMVSVRCINQCHKDITDSEHKAVGL